MVLPEVGGMGRLRAFLLRIVLAAVFVAAFAELPGSVAFPAIPATLSVDHTTLEAQFLQLMNGERAGSGMSPFVLDGSLSALARSHSQGQAAQGRIFHNPAKAGLLDRCFEVAENVGRGISVEQIHAAFMASPNHRAEILGRFDRVGVGVAVGGSFIYVTEVFCRAKSGTAQPAPAPAPVVKPAVIRRPPQPKPAPVPAPPEPAPAPAPPPPPPITSSGMGSPCRFL
jgi:hypothetical protein